MCWYLCAPPLRVVAVTLAASSLPSSSEPSSVSPSPVPRRLWKRKLAVQSLAGAPPLDELPHDAKCYCVTEVLLTSCPASQSSSPKLLSSVCVCERESARVCVCARLSSLRDVCGWEQSGRLNQVVWLLERLGVSGMEARGSTVKNQHRPTHVIENKCGNTKWEASPELRSKF